MHIPDGFLDAKTCMATAALSAAGLGVALRRVRRHLPQKNIPLMGLAAAFIFSAQMLNFPVAAGTSGHLVGAVLASVLLGPSAAVIVLTAVLIVQCLLFADGGISTLGANVFNMAIMGCLGGYGVYAGLYRIWGGPRGRLAAVAFASWCATVLAALCCAGELAWSKTVPWSAGFPAMIDVHMLIGLGEALITTLVIAALDRVGWEAPREPESEPGRRRFAAAAYGTLIALGLALFVSPFASPWPDGLERVAARLGFDRGAVAPPLGAAFFAGYRMPGISSAAGGTALAGAVGTVLVFILSIGLASKLVKPSRSER